ncbi:hypothetical protein WN944_014696 [Citrus x changshan-huyou]|uniref:Uncharacterized protein n=1 Tax=Citrus x changshan-huyou TaxID=2935761 RepID=A0AAP0QLY2_9ROSI
MEVRAVLYSKLSKYRHDIIAQICYARRLAEKLYPVARMIDLPGGHLVSHERTEEVNQTLIDLIKASEKKISPQDWTNLPQTSSGYLPLCLVRIERETISDFDISTSELCFQSLTFSADIFSSLSGDLAKGMSFVRTTSGPISYVSGPLEKLRLYLLYLCGLFMLAFEYARRLLQSLMIF